MNDPGPALQVPVGTMWEVRDGRGINVLHMANYTDSRIFDRIVHVVMVGLVFK